MIGVDIEMWMGMLFLTGLYRETAILKHPILLEEPDMMKMLAIPKITRKWDALMDRLKRKYNNASDSVPAPVVEEAEGCQGWNYCFRLYRTSH